MFLGVFTAAVLATVVAAAPTPDPLNPGPTVPCTKEVRLQIVMDIIGAFNDLDTARSIQTLNDAPFKPDGTIEFCINGAPCVRGGLNRETSRLAAIAARQAVAHVDSKYIAFDNGTTVMDAEVTFGAGALGVPIPIKTAIYVPGDFDTSDCLIRDLPAYFTLPNEVLGMPVNPPFLPNLGLPTIG